VGGPGAGLPEEHQPKEGREWRKRPERRRTRPSTYRLIIMKKRRLTIVVVEGGGHVLCGKAIGGVADDEGGFADGAVAAENALDLLLAVLEALVVGVLQQGGRQALVAEGRHPTSSTSRTVSNTENTRCRSQSPTAAESRAPRLHSRAPQAADSPPQSAGNADPLHFSYQLSKKYLDNVHFQDILYLYFYILRGNERRSSMSK